MLTTVAGTREKSGEPYCYEAGCEYDLPTREAKDLLSRPQGFPRAEAAAQKPSQTAERRGG